MNRLLLAAATAVLLAPHQPYAQDAAEGGMSMTNPLALFTQGMANGEPIEVADGVYQAVGFSNTFLITTDEGSVIVDTGLSFVANNHKKLLGPLVKGSVEYIVLTHAHPDHRQGVPVWREEGTDVIAHKNFAELRHYQERLAGAFYRRNFAQYFPMVPKTPVPESPGNYGADVEANILIDDEYRFTLGGVEFVCLYAPGETADQINLWIPEKGIVFLGDNFYDSFPNIYTLRGARTRYALNYVKSIDRALELEPDIALPSHGLPIKGKAEVRARLTKYRDAILYVHDAVVAGMNEGKDVHTLMREIELPEHLDIGQSYGNLPWSIRGIYEGYLGWFDGNPANMYEVPESGIHSDIVKIAGGPEPIIVQGHERLKAGDAVHALRLADVVLTDTADHQGALQLKLDALKHLESNSDNSNERGWLQHAISQVEALLINE